MRTEFSDARDLSYTFGQDMESTGTGVLIYCKDVLSYYSNYQLSPYLTDEEVVANCVFNFSIYEEQLKVTMMFSGNQTQVTLSNKIN